jgi:SAM-dependent methyltransferase
MNPDKKFKYLGKDLEAMSFAKNYHKWIIEEFKPYLGHRVAEVGAGTGNFSELLMTHTHHLIAFEPSENMYPLLKERFAENTSVETINSAFRREFSNLTGRLDSILYVNVLEHIEDDEQELSLVYKTLRQGGHALIFVPAHSFLYSDLDKHIGHFRRYRKKDIIELAKRAGFRIIKARYFDLAGVIPWYVAFVLFKKQITGAKVSLYDNLAVPIIQRIERYISPPIGKNILLIIQKV